jgi:AraC-like DNA-binding protein
VFFSQKVIIDLPLFAAFREIAQIIEKKNRPLIPDNLLLDQLGKLVSLYSHSNQLTPAFEKDHCLSEVKMYIKDKLHQKISLDEIAAIAAMDKFKFIRFFKRNTGLSPFSYIILQRIEKSKTLLKRGNPVIDAALDAGFYDQSHFSNYFKHYVGVTPIAYQAGCNILQE